MKKNALSQIQYKWTSFNPNEMYYTFQQIFVVVVEEYIVPYSILINQQS